MPYPNEHSARLQPPGKFAKKSYRRTKGGTLYGRIKIPATISIIWGKPVGKDKPSDPPIPQALRFNKKNWSVVDAKAWLAKNKIKVKLFEKAADGAVDKNLDKSTIVAVDYNNCIKVSDQEKSISVRILYA